MARSTLCTVAGFLLGLALAVPLDAAVVAGAQAQEARRKVERPRRKAPRRPAAERKERDDGRDFLREPEELPFGSTVWWRAMDLRNRGGFGGDANGCGPNEFCNYTLEAMCGAADASGTCAPVPEVCPDNVDPVCGCDNQTYSNACMANAAGTSVLSQGACAAAAT